MKVLFGNLRREYKAIKSEIDSAIFKTLNNGNFIIGEECNRFENAFAEYCGVKYCIGVASGTDAISLALMALNIGNGDYVITVPNTAMPTVSAISAIGAQPLFVDINDKTMLMDTEKLESLLISIPKEKLNRIKAIIPVHLYGLMCSMSRIQNIAKRYGLAIIEDCAQAHGAEYKKRKAGTYGVMGCFSFYPSKNLGCYGDGGCVVTNDKELHDKLKMLRNYGEHSRDNFPIIGINSRLDEIQAAVLNVKIAYLDQWNHKRCEIANEYIKNLSQYPILFQEPPGTQYNHVYHLMVIRNNQRDELINFLLKFNIQTSVHYPTPIYSQKSYKFLGQKISSYPSTEKICNQIISLPLYPFLTENEVESIINSIRKYFQ